VLVVALLVLAPDRCSQVELSWLALFAAFMIAVHLSNVPLVIGLLLVLLPLRRQLGAVAPLGRRGLLFALAPPMLAMLALVSVNMAAFGRVSLSPFGNVFLLARVIYDGPGMDALQRDCARADWLLCRQLNHFPPSADEFLWRADGPVILAGGAKRVSTEANAIIDAALIAEPVRQAGAFAANSLQQLSSFASGSGLGAWPHTVTPILERHFPIAERAAYAEARQSGEALAVPTWLQTIHIATALVGVAGCSALALRVRRQRIGGFAIAVLLALLCNAAITGGLSGPHDRYQSRVMWLPPLITLLGLPLIARPSQ
jgi:energy-coupling factor transporter transmembrane protein EcfT